MSIKSVTAPDTGLSKEEMVPPCFPSYTKDCKVVAEQFFDCFNKFAVKLMDNDHDAGRRGLTKCIEEKRKYEACMGAAGKTQPLKFFRVSTHVSMLRTCDTDDTDRY
jgi:hypothetical protein